MVIIERSLRVVSKVVLGLSMVQWLEKALKACLKKEEKFATVKEGSSSFIARLYSNDRDCYIAMVEYGGGGRRTFIFVLEEEGRGWKRMGEAVWELLPNGRFTHSNGAMKRPKEVKVQLQHHSYREALMVEQPRGL